MDKNLQTVALLGLGLMGGSLGLACRQNLRGVRVTAYARREETRRQALADGVVDEVYAEPGEAVRDADIIVICTPILDMPKLVQQIKPDLKPGAILTDVGSTKAMLIHEIHNILLDSDATFCGSHPMAGSEKTGLAAARPDLYTGATVIVTEDQQSAPAVVACLASFWQQIGANVLVLDAEAHDAVVAGTSHVPHLMAALLVRAAERATSDPAPFCGTGFRDATRIAAGSENVWHDIVKSNAEAIEDALSGVRDDLDRLIQMLQHKEFDKIRAWLAHARESRHTIMAQGNRNQQHEG